MSNATEAPADCYTTVGTICVLCRSDNQALCAQCATNYRPNNAGTLCVTVPSRSVAALQNLYVCMMALVVIVVALFVR